MRQTGRTFKTRATSQTVRKCQDESNSEDISDASDEIDGVEMSYARP